MLCISRSSLVSSVVRSLSSSPRLCASHYDVLGVTPHATQGDIKSAYYKLSKLYHPDLSSDETAAKKFRAISEAYEVLGNLKLKKMYDKGLLVGHGNTSRMDFKPEPEPTDPTLRFYKSHAKRQVMPTMDGKNPIYDFDAWSKNHYGDLLRKQLYEKEHLRKQREKRRDVHQSYNQEAILYLICGIAFLFVFLVIHGKSDYDQNMIQKNTEAAPSKAD